MSNTKKNIAYTMLYQILAMLIPLITTPYVSRVLGVDGIGVYSFTQSIMLYFMVFARYGFEDYGNRGIAQVRDDKGKRSETFWNIYAAQVLIAGTVCIVYAIYAFVMVQQNAGIARLQFIYLCCTVVTINWFFWGMEEFSITVTRSMFIKILSTVVIFIVVKKQSDLWKYALIVSACNLLSDIIMWFFLKKYIYWVRPSWDKVKNIIKEGFFLFIPLVSRSVFVYMDKIMLGVMSTMAQVAYYENSEKIILAPTSIATALGMVMLPKASNMIYKGEKDRGKFFLDISMQWVMCMAMAFAFGLSAVSKIFARLYFGGGFDTCGVLIPFMSITIVLVAWANVIKTQYLIPYCKDKIFMYSIMLGAVVNFIIDFITIPYWGAMGAVWGWVAAEFSITFFQTFMARKDIQIGNLIKKTVPYFCIGIIMYIIVSAVGDDRSYTILTLGLKIFVGVLVYLGLTLLYWIKFKPELAVQVFSILRKRRASDGE